MGCDHLVGDACGCEGGDLSQSPGTGVPADAN